jgi:hypothetical protein
MNTQTCEYDLPEPTRLVLFGSLDEFEVHLRNHFLSFDEPWTRLPKGKYLKEFAQNLAAGGVTLMEALPMIYQQVAQVLHEGIQFAERKPIYIRCEMKRQAAGPQANVGMAHYLLAEHGFVVIAFQGCVRTAYFPDHAQPDDSWHTLFQKGWDYLGQKARKANYRDWSGQEHVTQGQPEFYSKKNWEVCPNPHPKRLDQIQLSPGLQTLLDKAREAARTARGDSHG